jgi:hypothetical protein
MLKRLFGSREEDICPNCDTVCSTTDVFCPNCQKNLDELFEQLPKEEFETKPFINISQNHKLILNWTLATVVGFVLGEVYLRSLTFSIVPYIKSEFDWDGIMLSVADGVATGLSVGFFQWLVLKKYFTHNWLWILATLIGITFGNFTESFIIVLTRNQPLTYIFTWSSAVVNLIILFIAGLEIGLIQMVVLQKFLSKSWIWVLTLGISWTVATIIGNDVIYPIFYPSIDGLLIQYGISLFAEIVIYGTSGLIFGIITGSLLSWLFKQNRIIIQTAT